MGGRGAFLVNIDIFYREEWGVAPLLFLCRMKTVLPLKSKGGAEQGHGGGGAVQDRLGEEGGRPSRAETEFGGWREREGGGLENQTADSTGGV